MSERAASRGARAGVLAVALLAAACSGAAGGSGAELRLHVSDGQVRETGAECAGTGPWRRVHAGAGYVVEDRDGEALAEGELPAGAAAEAAPGIDWQTERRPTNCVFALEVANLPEREGYQLRVAGRPPIGLEAESLDDDEPVHLLIE